MVAERVDPPANRTSRPSAVRLVRPIAVGQIGVLAILVSVCLIPVGLAQEAPHGSGAMVSHISPSGIRAYRPGKWGLIDVHAVNPTDEPKEILAVTFFDEDVHLQYGRRIWLPPKSRLQSTHPVRLPAAGPDANQRLDLHTLVMDPSRPREVLVRGDSGYLQLDGLLRVTHDLSMTGLIEAPAPRPETFVLFPDVDHEAVSELVIAARLKANHTRRVNDLIERLLPTSEESFEALDHLVIADNRVVDDLAGLAAVRRWLFAGGRLWVMLDRVDARVLERLLGDEFVGEVVDRVGLTTVRLESRSTGQSVVTTQEHDKPVEFVRLAVSDVEVECQVDGWPAAFWKTCGDGRLLVTTLGPRGWVRPRTTADRVTERDAGGQSRDRLPQPGGATVAGQPGISLPDRNSESTYNPYAPSRFVLLEPMASLIPDFFSTRPAQALPPATLEPIMREHVGYSIVDRRLVVGLLLGFSGLIVGLGCWLWRRGALEWLGVLGPGVGLAVSLFLVLLGRSQRTAVPPMVASIQFVQSIPGTDDVRSEGLAGLYSPDTGTAVVGAKRGGWLLPESSGFHNTTRRLIWTDLDQWHWENLPETAGIRSAVFQVSSSWPDRLEARATFGPDGLTGRLHVPGGRQPSDSMLATRDGRVGVKWNPDGSFLAQASDVFSAEQFLAAGLLSDEQDRRRRLLEQLLMNPQRWDIPATPHLLFWTDPWDFGFRFDEQRRTLGSALVAVPVKLERPAVGQHITIAAPFLPYRAVANPDGSPPPAWWDAQRRQWAEKAVPSQTWLRFQLPKVLLPVELIRGRFHVQVRGPVGKLEIAGSRRGTDDVVVWKTWNDPVGTLSLDLADHDLPQVTDDGGLLIRVTAGDPRQPELMLPSATDGPSASYWQIESLTLQLTVTTIDPMPTTGVRPGETGKDAE